MRYLVASLLLVFANLALSGDFDSEIANIQTNVQANVVIVKFQSDPTNGPACATDSRMTLDVSTDIGKATFSVLLSAHVAGKRVYGRGTDTCDHMTDMDAFRYVRIF